MTATDELRKLLDERGVEYEKATFVLDFTARRANETSWLHDDCRCEFTEFPAGSTQLVVYRLTPEQAIAATLGDDDYERKMDALLCRLTNGKFSKSRQYDLDFMESCVNEEFEKIYEDELADATLGSDREAELEALAKDLYESATDFSFKGWMSYYKARFAALGIEVEP